MLTNKIDPDLLQFFMGHTLNGQASSYMNFRTEDLRKEYELVERHLAIEKTSMEEKSSSGNGRIKNLESKIQEIENTKERLQKLEEENKRISEIIDARNDELQMSEADNIKLYQALEKIVGKLNELTNEPLTIDDFLDWTK